MNNKQAIKELIAFQDKLGDICEKCFLVYEGKEAKAITDRLCDKMTAIGIAINAIQGIDLLTEGVCGK